VAKVFDINQDIQLSPGVGFNLLGDKFNVQQTVPPDPALEAASKPLTTFGIDLGVLMRYQKAWGLGLAVSNLNGPKASNTTNDKLPMVLRAGASYLFQDWLLGAAAFKATMGQSSNDYDYNVGPKPGLSITLWGYGSAKTKMN